MFIPLLQIREKSRLVKQKKYQEIRVQKLMHRASRRKAKCIFKSQTKTVMPGYISCGKWRTQVPDHRSISPSFPRRTEQVCCYAGILLYLKFCQAKYICSPPPYGGLRFIISLSIGQISHILRIPNKGRRLFARGIVLYRQDKYFLIYPHLF